MKNKIVKHFYVREPKKDRKGEAPIYLRITVNGERAEISTDRRVNPGNREKAAERVADNHYTVLLSQSFRVHIFS